MSTYHEEAGLAHGAANPVWKVTFVEGFSGELLMVEVHAAEYQQAINKATGRLNLDWRKPEGSYFFKRCMRG